MAAIILDDFVIREGHPYLVILQSDGEVFYYHRTPPPGKAWLYRAGIKKIRSLELPVIHEDFPIAVVRTDYVSSQTLRNFTLTLLMVMGGILAFLVRRVIIVSLVRSKALEDLEAVQSQLVTNDRVVFFSLLSMKLAHEFNTPLGIIITAQSFLAGNDVSFLGTGEGRKMLNMIGDAAIRMKSLIKRMQDSVPNQLKEELVETNIYETATEIVMTIHQEADEVRIDIPEDLTWKLRKKALTLIFEELINNASQHGRSSDRKLRLKISGNVESRGLVILIEDGGSGIPEHMEVHVFSPFTTARSMQTGSGLGLYLAMNYSAEFLNGTLIYATGGNGGARFTLTIPMDIIKSV